MSEGKELKQAQAVYDSICKALDARNWKYSKAEDMLSIYCTAQGEDLPMDIIMSVNAELSVVCLFSQMPFSVPEPRREALAVAVSQANMQIVDGSFDYDFKTGKIWFRMTSCYLESLISESIFEYMLFTSLLTIDRYNDKFFMVTKKDMDTKEIIDLFK